MPDEGAQARGRAVTLFAVLDTLVNVAIFAFIGALIYLWFRPDPGERDAADD